MTLVAIFGATSAIATEFARQWAGKAPTDFVFVGRDESSLNALAADLTVRHPQSKNVAIVGDLTTVKGIEKVSSQVLKIGTPDYVLIAQGSLPDQETAQKNLELAAETLFINGASPALIAEAFSTPMIRAARGHITVIGSVAGDRGRASNYIYGSAKSELEAYVKGMQHRLHGTPVHVMLVKPGPVNTPMTAHLQEKSRGFASPAQVASDIIRGISKGKKVIYTPLKWRLIMLVVRNLPSAIFNRTSL